MTFTFSFYCVVQYIFSFSSLSLSLSLSLSPPLLALRFMAEWRLQDYVPVSINSSAGIHPKVGEASYKNMKTSALDCGVAVRRPSPVVRHLVSVGVTMQAYSKMLQAHDSRQCPLCDLNCNWINQLSNTTVWWLDICCLLHGINYMFRLLWPASG